MLGDIKVWVWNWRISKKGLKQAPCNSHGNFLPHQSSDIPRKIKYLPVQVSVSETSSNASDSKTYWQTFGGTLSCTLGEFPDNISFKIRTFSKMCLNSLTSLPGPGGINQSTNTHSFILWEEPSSAECSSFQIALLWELARVYTLGICTYLPEIMLPVFCMRQAALPCAGSSQMRTRELCSLILQQIRH